MINAVFDAAVSGEDHRTDLVVLQRFSAGE